VADRSVKVRLSMDTYDYLRKMQEAGKVGEDSMRKIEKSAMSTDQAIDQVGSTAGKMSLATAAGMGMTIKAATDWETAWTGVSKTVDGTAAEMAALEDGLRGLAREMPVTHAEIAATAEAAGQLGVAQKDILGFTEVMLQLGTSTNLSADEAATSISQLMNVMQTAPEDVDNLGAALVALGNNGASTERDIIQMAQRIAGAGAQIGLAEADVLAIANAVASAGIEVEAGGTAISRVFTNMAIAAKQGGEKLDGFAATAGMTSEQFVEAFEKDPARAFAKFTGGLDDVKKSGGDVFSLLKSLGMSDVRVSQALLAMAGSGDMLTESLNLGSQAWEENTALAQEYERFASTTASEVTLAWNNIKEAGIELGEVMLPAVASLAGGVADVAHAFASLPDGTKQAIVGVGGFLTVAGGSVFVLSQVVTSVTSAKAAMEALGISTSLTTTKMSLLSRTALFGGGAAIAGLSMLADESTSAGQAIETLGLTAGGALMGFAVGGPIGAAVGGGIGLVGGLTKNLWDATDAGRGLKGATDEMAAEEQQAKVEALAGSFDILAGSASKANRELVLSQLRELDKDMQAALQYVGISERTVVEALLGDEESIERINRKLGKALAQAEEFDPLGTMGLNAGLAEDALDKLGVSMRAVRVEVVKNKLATDDWAAAFPGIPKRVLTKLETEGIPESRGELKALVEQMDLTPKEIKSIFELFGYRAGKGEIKDLSGDLEALDKKDATPKVTVKADTTAAERARRLIDSITSKVITVTTRHEVARPGAPVAHAEGGYISGPGTATSDSIPAYLSNGEYVIRAAAVAKYGISMFDGLNAMRFAGGGSVSRRMRRQESGGGEFWSDDELKGLTLTMRALRAAVEDQTAVLGEAQAAQTATASAMEALHAATISTWNSPLFQGTGADPAWLSGGTAGGAGDPLSVLRGDIATGRVREDLQRQLEALGMSGPALDALLSQGSNDDISGLIARGEVGQYAALYAERAALQERVGTHAADTAYGDLLAQQTLQVEQMTKLLRETEKRADRAERQRDRAIEATERQATELARALKGEARRGQRSRK
jgi:TP901 family phage tail tape measure protein